MALISMGFDNIRTGKGQLVVMDSLIFPAGKIHCLCRELRSKNFHCNTDEW